jgi:hypothetical protein
MAAVAAGRRTSFLSIHYLSYVSLRLNKSTGDGIWEKRRKGQLEKYWCMRPWVASDGDDGRGLHSSTSQLNLSRFLHKIHPTHTPLLLNTP